MKRGVAGAVCAKVVDGGSRFWRPTDFEASPLPVDAALARLADTGVLRRVRRGLYWRGPETRLGMAPPDQSILVEALVGTRGVGPAGASAALQLGLTSQFPARLEIAAPVRPPIGVPGITFRDRSSRAGRLEAALTPTEVAVLEVLEDWDDVVELPTEDAVDELINVLKNRVDVSRLTRAASGERPKVRERLRTLLDRAGFPEAAQTVLPARSARTREAARVGANHSA